MNNLSASLSTLVFGFCQEQGQPDGSVCGCARGGPPLRERRLAESGGREAEAGGTRRGEEEGGRDRQAEEGFLSPAQVQAEAEHRPETVYNPWFYGELLP